MNKCLDHAGPSFSPSSASDGDHDSYSFFEFDWKISQIGYIGGLVAGVALGSTLDGLKGSFEFKAKGLPLFCTYLCHTLARVRYKFVP